MPCYYKTITLGPSEQFVLPPDAEIIGVSDTTALSAINDCIDLTKLDQQGRYGFVILARESDNDSRSYDSDSDTYYPGVMFEGNYYPFSSSIWWSSTDVLENVNGAFASLPFGPLITNICQSSNSDYSRNSVKRYLIFDTFSLIANSLELVAITDAPNTGSGIPQAQFRIPCQSQADIINAGHSGVC